MKEITNRSAITVYPKKPFKEWAQKYNVSPIKNLKQRINERHVYLIDWTYDEGFSDVVEPYHLKIFEYELLSWNSIKKEWPQNRTFEKFLEWFKVELCDDLFDLENEKIVAEKL